MKVLIQETVEIDPVAWAKEFNIELKEVREDVKSYFGSFCQSQADYLECGIDSQ